MVQKIFILLRIMVPDLKDWNWLENVTAGGVHVLLSRFYPDFIQILSRFYLDFIQFLSRFYQDFVLILS